MNWLISIHLYLWRNSIRRWHEQPLSLLSKLTVSGLLGILGAVVILGTRHLGNELDSRLEDRDILTVVVSEVFPREIAFSSLMDEAQDDGPGWSAFGDNVNSFYQAGVFAQTLTGERLPVWGIENLARHQFVDDFYILSDQGPVNERVPFKVAERWSEATRVRPHGMIEKVMFDRSILVGGLERLGPVLATGYTRTTVIDARTIDEIERIHLIAKTFSDLEGRRNMVQSNLAILRDLERIRGIQAQALLGVSLGASAVLGLVFGSLAWMEFREERYLLSLLRSFGVGRLSLLGHSVTENVLLAVAGVALGFGVLHLGVSNTDLEAVKMTWLRATDELLGHEGQLLLIGAAVGGLFSCVPIAIALRKPLGLVLN